MGLFKRFSIKSLSKFVAAPALFCLVIITLQMAENLPMIGLGETLAKSKRTAKDEVSISATYDSMLGHPSSVNLSEMLKLINSTGEEWVFSEAENPYFKRIFYQEHYQGFPVRIMDKSQTAYFIRGYYDDRYYEDLGVRYVRTVVQVDGPCPTWVCTGKDQLPKVMDEYTKFRQEMYYKLKFVALLWYDNYSGNIQSNCFASDGAALARPINKSHHFQYVLTCPLPNIGVFPANVSFTLSPYDSVRNIAEIYYPKDKLDDNNWSVVLCVMPLFGQLDDESTPFFVNWMELNRLTGISKVVTNNVTLHLTGGIIDKAFRYYINSGFLEMTNYPPTFASWNKSIEREVAHSISSITKADCYFRYMKTFRFTAIYDLDEIMIPQKFATISDYLQDMFENIPSSKMATCFKLKSVQHMTYFNTRNDLERRLYPEYLPLCRLTERWPPENPKYVVLEKSISNNRFLSASSNHDCRPVMDPTRQKETDDFISYFLPTDEILVHHYRDACHPQLKGSPIGDLCKMRENSTIYDPIVPLRYGRKLQLRVRNVLQQLGWFLSS